MCGGTGSLTKCDTFSAKMCEPGQQAERLQRWSTPIVCCHLRAVPGFLSVDAFCWEVVSLFLQTISFLVSLHGKDISQGPHLILSPLSVLNNWVDELNRYSEFNCRSLITTFLTRELLVFYASVLCQVCAEAGFHKLCWRQGKSRETESSHSKRVEEHQRSSHNLRGEYVLGSAAECCTHLVGILLLSYLNICLLFSLPDCQICLKEESFLRQFSWHTLVVDEAHRLKNRDSLLHQSLLDVIESLERTKLRGLICAVNVQWVAQMSRTRIFFFPV